MKATQKKIIFTTIQLFNQNGVGNVRIQDIAKAADISPGNLTYHYRTKKDLVRGVLNFKYNALKSTPTDIIKFDNPIGWVRMMKIYLEAQMKFRFYYRDILEICNLLPDIKEDYKRQIQFIMDFNKKLVQFMVGIEIIKDEDAFDGDLDYLIRNSWAIISNWLSQQEIFGADLEEPIIATLELYYPHMARKGKEEYFAVITKNLPQMLQQLEEEKKAAKLKAKSNQ